MHFSALGIKHCFKLTFQLHWCLSIFIFREASFEAMTFILISSFCVFIRPFEDQFCIR